MQVHVIFTTQVKAALGAESQVVTLRDEATVWDAIQSLAEEHPSAFSSYVLADGELLPSILLTVNDQQVDSMKQLVDGDQLMLLSAISGG